MLPTEVLDQITSLNTQHRELLSVINQLSRPKEIANQLVLNDLVARIKAGFATADRAIENFEATIAVENDSVTKNEEDIYLAKIQEDFKLARASFRKLFLQASKTLNGTRYAQATEALLRPQSPETPPGPNSTLRQRQPPIIPHNDASLLQSASDVTLALKRTHALLEQELEKSTLSLETLDHSSQTLRQLEHKYGAFDVLLRGSKRLINELEQADKWDRWMIYGGLAIFGLTCLWIIYKRILRGPLGLIIWAGEKVLGFGPAVSSIGHVLSSDMTTPVITPIYTNVEMKDSLVDSDFTGFYTDEPGWTEAEDIVTEVVTVTIRETSH